jgi:predicted anti-sigma-YlaC factor YlaD
MTEARPKLTRRIHGMMFKLPLMITCDAFENFILAYLEDELTARQKFTFETHLKLCRECRDYLQAYKTSLELAKAACKDDGGLPEEVPEDLVAAVLAARDC